MAAHVTVGLAAGMEGCRSESPNSMGTGTPMVLVSVQGHTSAPPGRAASVPAPARKQRPRTMERAAPSISTGIPLKPQPAEQARHSSDDAIESDTETDGVIDGTGMSRLPDAAGLADADSTHNTTGNSLDDFIAGQSYASYAGSIQQRIMKAKRYPLRAQQAGMQGEVGFWLMIAPNGELLDVKIRQPARYALLNDATKSTVRRAAPFPPHPPDAPGEPLPVEGSLTYFVQR